MSHTHHMCVSFSRYACTACAERTHDTHVGSCFKTTRHSLQIDYTLAKLLGYGVSDDATNEVLFDISKTNRGCDIQYSCQMACGCCLVDWCLTTLMLAAESAKCDTVVQLIRHKTDVDQAGQVLLYISECQLFAAYCLDIQALTRCWPPSFERRPGAPRADATHIHVLVPCFAHICDGPMLPVYAVGIHTEAMPKEAAVGIHTP